MADPMRPPRYRSEISKAVGRLERLKLRRQALVKKLDAIDNEIRDALRLVASLIDAGAPPDVYSAAHPGAGD
jgi:hypothetical protein